MSGVRRIRAAAVGLIVYGLLGLGLLILAYVVANQTFQQIEALQALLSTQRTALVGSLRGTSSTLTIASSSFGTMGQTLGQAQDSTRQAAIFARDLSKTMQTLGNTLRTPLFGVLVLGDIGGGFDQAGQQLAIIAGSLDATGNTLGQNATDLQAVKQRLSQMQSQVETLTQALDTMPPQATQSGVLPIYQLAIYGLLGWLGIQALVSIMWGVLLFRRSLVRPSTAVLTSAV